MRKKEINSKFIKSKIGQEEMIGFGVILILIAIVMVAFLYFSMNGSDKEAVESYQVNSFIQAFLQYNSKCQEENYGVIENVSIQDLIKKCYENETCMNNEKGPCEILNETSKEIIVESWQINPQSPRVGYEFIVADSENNVVASSWEGTETYNARGGRQPLGISGENLKIDLTIFFNQTSTT